MSMENNNKLNELIREYGAGAEVTITDTTRFREDLGFSSLDFMSFLGELEDEFDIEIDQDRALQIVTVGDAYAYLKELTEE